MIKNINFFKILFVLKNRNSYINTGDLAGEAKINYKNISKYLTSLEEKGFIERDVYQEGKIRFIFNSLTLKGENYDIPSFYELILKKNYL